MVREKCTASQVIFWWLFRVSYRPSLTFRKLTSKLGEVIIISHTHCSIVMEELKASLPNVTWSYISPHYEMEIIELHIVVRDVGRQYHDCHQTILNSCN